MKWTLIKIYISSELDFKLIIYEFHLHRDQLKSIFENLVPFHCHWDGGRCSTCYWQLHHI